MTLEELRKEDKEEEEESREEESEDTNKSFDEALLETISTLTEHVKALSESQADLDSRLHKALEEKPETQLELQPATTDSEDIGADVTVPDDQSGEDKPEGDDSGLSMQEKSNFDFTTETPRPNAAIESVNKSSEVPDLSMVLKDARDNGYDGLNKVAQKILKGDYYTPTDDEVGQY